MSTHVEWTRATRRPELVGDDFADGFGTTVDAGYLGLFVGHSSGGAVVEGTRDELRAWLTHALALLDDRAKCPLCGHPGRTQCDRYPSTETPER